MSQKTRYLFGILFTIIIGSILYYYLCCRHCTANSNTDEGAENTTTETIDNSTKTPFSVKDIDGDYSFNQNDNFNFKMSYYSILEPISDALNESVLDVKDYMLQDSLKMLHITGYYTNSEINNSAFPNLGLARANAVKNYFVSTGVSSKNIDTYGELKDDLLPDNNSIFYGPVGYQISNPDIESAAKMEALMALGRNIKENPLVLYFETGASTINLTAEQRQKIADISRYIDKVDDATIHVIGYTDNTGDAFSNMKLGQNRADFIKRYLMGNAISESQIITSSQGQNNPIAVNSTEEGRQLNRRVVVTIN